MCLMGWHVCHGARLLRCSREAPSSAEPSRRTAVRPRCTHLLRGSLGLHWGCMHNLHAAQGAVHALLVHRACGHTCVPQGYGLTETTAASFIMLPTPKMAYTRGFAVSNLLQWLAATNLLQFAVTELLQL